MASRFSRRTLGSASGSGLVASPLQQPSVRWCLSQKLWIYERTKSLQARRLDADQKHEPSRPSQKAGTWVLTADKARC